MHWVIPVISIPQSYRLITALVYAFGPVTLYLFVKYLTQRESTAFISAIIYSVVLGPIYSATPFASELSAILQYVPYNLIVLTLFGEGPHILGLTLIPLALYILLHSLRRPCFKNIFLTSLTIAAVALTNLIALYSFAIISVITLLSEVLRGEAVRKMKTALICGVVSYGLVAFCYDYSFIESSLSFNPLGGDFVLSWQNFAVMLTIVAATLSAFSIYYKKRRLSQHLYLTSAWTVVFLTITAMWHLFKIPLAPQSNRYIPELTISISLFLGIATTSISRKLVKAVPESLQPAWKPLMTVVTLLIILALPVATSTWELTQPNNDIESTPEYNMAQWLMDNNGLQRVYATGTVSFWLNVFTEIPQLRGGSDQGATNPWGIDAATEINTGKDEELGVLWCKALNIRYVIVIYPNADTPYHDYIFPNRFEKTLHLRHTYMGFSIFEVPLINSDLVQPVDVANLQDLETIKRINDVKALQRYVNLVEAMSTATVHFRYDEVDRLEIRVTNATEKAHILVKMTYDERWKASIDGRSVTITAVGPDLMLINPNKKGNYILELVCGKSASEILGTAITISTILILLVFTANNFRKRVLKLLPKNQPN